MVYINNGTVLQNEDTAVTLGNFDGFHKGHQKLIECLNNFTGLRKVVFSFSPHPLSILRGVEMKPVFSLDERIYILSGMHVDVFVEYPFTKAFAGTSPGDFLERVLVNQLRCKALVVGEDYRFGRDQSGSAQTIQAVGKLLGIDVAIIPKVNEGGEKISSTRIRSHIKSGEMEEANRLLGRNYFVQGVVETGRRLGRTINYPTINIIPPPAKLLPPRGVYAVRICWDGQKYLGITNIGNNPTVGNTKQTVETHIFDFNGALYGQKVTVALIKRIRREIKFNGLQELKERIAEDERIAREYFKR